MPVGFGRRAGSVSDLDQSHLRDASRRLADPVGGDGTIRFVLRADAVSGPADGVAGKCRDSEKYSRYRTRKDHTVSYCRVDLSRRTI